MTTPAITDLTNLADGVVYTATVTVNGTSYPLSIRGYPLLTYGDLIAQLNRQLTVALRGIAVVTLTTAGMIFTSTTTGPLSTVTLTDGATNPLFASLGGYILTGTPGTSTPGTSSNVTLRWSNDGGHTWSGEMIESVGGIGDTAKRVLFRRLGSTSQTKGFDRVFELSSSDPYQVVLIAADMEAQSEG